MKEQTLIDVGALFAVAIVIVCIAIACKVCNSDDIDPRDFQFFRAMRRYLGIGDDVAPLVASAPADDDPDSRARAMDAVL